MPGKGWKRLEIAGMAGHSWKCLGMAGYGWNCLKWLEMAGIGYTKMKISGNGWTVSFADEYNCHSQLPVPPLVGNLVFNPSRRASSGGET